MSNGSLINYYEKNLRTIEHVNPKLYKKLLDPKSSPSQNNFFYDFIKSKEGELIPAIRDEKGNFRPLHSLVDPYREAKRLLDTIEDEAYLILLGLGAAYYAKEALNKNTVTSLLVIDFNLDSIKELLAKMDYSDLFRDKRFFLFIDPDEAELETHILSFYKPVLHGGINIIPLRSRTSASFDLELFNKATEKIKQSLDRVSADYSVQAHFGKRWFSNTIKNLIGMGEKAAPLLPDLKKKRAAVIAAGPSLSMQIDMLKQKRESFYIIASDTSLPCLLNEGIKPEIVISIDCQHISYYHFMQGLPKESLLFLDLASPPSFASYSENTFYFSGSHPLSSYICKNFFSFPLLDISGGNVTYAALSLAEMLGAEHIELYGADFSYPKGLSYARGAYIHSFFNKQQTRLKALEALYSSFLYRTPVEKIFHSEKYFHSEKIPHEINPVENWYYESSTLRSYRERLEEKSIAIKAEVIAVEGMGAPIRIAAKNKTEKKENNIPSFTPPSFSASSFLSDYHNKIKNLDINKLDNEDMDVFLSLLPSAAAIKRQNPKDNFEALFEKTKKLCMKTIYRAINHSHIMEA